MWTLTLELLTEEIQPAIKMHTDNPLSQWSGHEAQHTGCAFITEKTAYHKLPLCKFITMLLQNAAFKGFYLFIIDIFIIFRFARFLSSFFSISWKQSAKLSRALSR